MRVCALKYNYVNWFALATMLMVMMQGKSLQLLLLILVCMLCGKCAHTHTHMLILKFCMFAGEE